MMEVFEVKIIKNRMAIRRSMTRDRLMIERQGAGVFGSPCPFTIGMTHGKRR